MSADKELEARKETRSDGYWETYWRYGYVVEGQPAIVLERYERNESRALDCAEKAAKAHHKALEDLGMFVRVDAFIQKWRTRSRGNTDEFDAATFSTRVVLNPRTDMTPAEAILRARQAREMAVLDT